MNKSLKSIENKLFQDGIEKLIEWTNKKNFDVHFGHCLTDEYRPADRLITISTRFGEEKQLYAFLHECGHLLLGKDEKSYTKKYPSSAKMWEFNSNKKLERSKKYKVDVVSEEIDAWRKGKEIAKRLDIYVNDENYYSLMSECVYGYILHVARR